MLGFRGSKPSPADGDSSTPSSYRCTGCITDVRQPIYAIAVSPDGQMFAYGGDSRVLPWSTRYHAYNIHRQTRSWGPHAQDYCPSWGPGLLSRGLWGRDDITLAGWKWAVDWHHLGISGDMVQKQWGMEALVRTGHCQHWIIILRSLWCWHAFGWWEAAKSSAQPLPFKATAFA